MSHKHHLKLRRSKKPSLTLRFTCTTCDAKLVYWRSGIFRMLLNNYAYKPAYRIGQW